MNSDIDPQVAEALGQTQRIQAVIDEQARRLDTECFKGIDKARSVAVTLNGRHWLTDLHIEEGLLRLGAETVAQRVNEAMRNALATATAAREAEQQRLMESMTDIVGSLEGAFGVTETKPQ